jgi:dTDP-4-dehydrorhamnose reductase
VFNILERYQAGQNMAWGVYHYAGQPSCSWYEFAGYIVDQAFREGLITSMPDIRRIHTAEYPTLARRPANSRLDSGKLMTAFPGSCPSNWRAGVAALIKHIKRNK